MAASRISSKKKGTEHPFTVLLLGSIVLLSATVTEDGLAAVLRLGKGDMRRVLNVLQV